ncbi:MAG: sporulation protein YunB [Clostridiaceae bacterium]|nr:sporulation protein YunB [Clostridiaceae bacterium]
MRAWAYRGFRYRFGCRRKRRKSYKKSYNTYLVIGVILLIIIYSFSLFNRKIKPTVISIAEARAKYIATEAIAEAVNEKIAESNLQYEDLVFFQKDNAGQITALQANIVKMNQIKADISMSIQQKIASLDSVKIHVPLGNAFDNQIFSGFGPRIPVRVVPVGTTQADFKSTFNGAGINQTKHEISLHVHTYVAVLLPIAKVSAEVVTTVPVAETIIVGNVPEQYINVHGIDTNDPTAIVDILP